MPIISPGCISPMFSSGAHLNYLLDKYPNGSSVALSVNKLNSSATKCMRVRRSTDDTEMDIGFLGSDLDTIALCDFCGIGNGFVKIWYDQNGTNNAVQNTNANQPQIVSSGIVISGSHNKPTIQFIDSSTSAIGKYLEVDCWHSISDQVVNLWTVYELSNNGNYPTINGTNPDVRGLYVGHDTTSRKSRSQTIRTGGTTTAIGATAFTLNNYYLRLTTANRTLLQSYLNGSDAPDSSSNDRNENFTDVTKYLIGVTLYTTATGSIKLSSYIGYIGDQSTNKVGIESFIKSYFDDTRHLALSNPDFRSFANLTKSVGNPMTNMCVPFISKETKIGDTYYGLSQTSLTGLTSFTLWTSTDLINWTKRGVVFSGTTTSWDRNYMVHPSIVKVGSLWHMYYSATTGPGYTGNHYVGLATSPDYINWTRYQSTPIYAPQAYSPYVILIGSTFYMYYWNRLTNAGSAVSKIEYATSSDGINWTYGGTAINTLVGDWDYFTGSSRNIDPCIIKNNAGYYEMVFTAYNLSTTQMFGYAVSFDGIVWKKYGSPIMQVSPSGWDSLYIGNPILYEFPDGSARLLYSGIAANFEQSGFATI